MPFFPPWATLQPRPDSQEAGAAPSSSPLLTNIPGRGTKTVGREETHFTCRGLLCDSRLQGPSLSLPAALGEGDDLSLSAPS